MDNAQLDHCLREYAFNGFRKTRQTIDTGNENILNTPLLEVIENTQSEMSPF
jgi:hypothetical protein